MVLFCVSPGLPVLQPEAVIRRQADAHWLIETAGGEIGARCSLWWRSTPAYPGQRLGLIGHYAAREAGAASRLLALAGEQLAGQGCTMAVGPMDGSTWQQYRLLTWRGSEPPFFLEPDNPDDWPDQFGAAGFTPLGHYTSALTVDLDARTESLERVARRAARQGVTIRPLHLAQLEIELNRVYPLALAAFSRNFLYTPLDLASFLAQYLPLRPYLRPELVLLAERGDQLLGFILALPDLLQGRRGQTIDTVILKTVAVHPNDSTAGLGHLLAARCHQAAAGLGYRRVIHALMHEDNPSQHISARFHGRTIRRYTLFARALS